MVASLRCVPVAHALMSSGDALSILWTMERSWNVALPAPPPPPEGIAAWFVTPHENESTSISSLCLSSSDSPLISPIFAKMSEAITIPPDESAADNRASDGAGHVNALRRLVVLRY